VLGAILVFSFIIPNLASSFENSQRQYVGLIGDFTLTTLPKEITQKMSAGLTKLEIDGSAAPLLAERWTVEQDGKTYRFVLKKNVFWQDGKELIPEDINYQLKDVETIITPNDIVFKLPDSYAPFPTVVSEPILRTGKMTHWFFFEKPSIIGVGPYKLADYKQNGSRLTELTIDGKNERITYRFYLTEKDAVTAFKHGKVDSISDLSQKYNIMDWPNTIAETRLQTNRYLAVFFNIRNPVFQKNIRQALSYSLEKTTGDSRASGPISPESWAYLEGAKTYDKDLPRAIERALDGVPAQPLDLELTTTALFEPQAEIIKKQWEEFGQQAAAACQTSANVENKDHCQNLAIKVNIRISNFPDTSNFQMLLVGQEIAPDPDQYHLWHSEQSSNFSGYKNTRIDTLLEKGRQTFDQSQRRETYQEFQQFFLEDAPAIFLNHLESYSVKRK
jgi:peptide/nickel transport system substrate-binding protein